MKKFINIKFAELFLKGKNRDDFVNVLFKNIKKALHDKKINLENKRDSFFLFYEQEDENDIFNILKMIPGIAFFNICYLVDNDLQKIKEMSQSLLENKKTFKLEIKRKFKNFISREQLISETATYLLTNIDGLSVNVSNPEIILNIEIFNSNNSIIWIEKVIGTGGFPVGINGKCLSLLSGGIDSPVASQQLQKKGQIVDYLTFITSDVTEKTINKLKTLINQITLNSRIHKAKLYIVDFTTIQHELMHASNPKYRITLMRRSFYRIAEAIAKQYGYNALVCGDSLGQVASQTIESIHTISSACKEIQIFRPLLTFDKQDIIKIAKEIGTYPISISEHEDVCSMFAPEHPITKPNLPLAIALENELQLLNYLELKVIEKLKIV